MAESKLTTAAQDVLAERARQIEVEGWSPEHDADYVKGEMARAAASYALGSTWTKQMRSGAAPAPWPWTVRWWKPTTPRQDLVKAGALILAEIERLDREAGRAALQLQGGSVAVSEQAYFTPEEYALEAIMKGVLRHWPSDVEPDGTNATVVITLAQAKLIRTMLRDSLRARRWDAWNREAREILGPALQGRSSAHD